LSAGVTPLVSLLHKLYLWTASDHRHARRHADRIGPNPSAAGSLV